MLQMPRCKTIFKFVKKLYPKTKANVAQFSYGSLLFNIHLPPMLVRNQNILKANSIKFYKIIKNLKAKKLK